MAWTSAQRPLRALLVVVLCAFLAPASSQPADAMASPGPAPAGSGLPVPSAAPGKANGANSQDIATFFPKINGDLTQVTWAHAVNSWSLLEKALNDSALMMLEADVIMGTTPGSTVQEPVMGHPPAVTSDLSLKDFLRNVTAFNLDNKDQRKGIKLDFKTIGVFEQAMDSLKANFATVPEFPVWLNADVLPGPVNATTLAVDVNKFLEKAKTNYPQLMLSLGWTTRWGKGLDDQDQTKVPVEEVKYSQDNVDAMIEALNVSGVKQPITYAVRAAFVANSLKELKKLLEKTPQPDGGKATLTVWSSDDTDVVDVKSLKKNILDLGKSRVFLDVGEKLSKELDLAHSASVSTYASVATTVMALLAVMLRGF